MRRLGARSGAAAGMSALAAFLLAALLLAGCTAVGQAPDASSGTGCHGVVGDADGDGRADPVLGMPGAAAGAGAVVLLRGASAGPVAVRRVDAPGAAAAVRGGRFGSAVSVGDVSGDGCADVLVGAPEQVVRTGHDAVDRGSMTLLTGARGRGIRAGVAERVDARTLGLPPPRMPGFAGPAERRIAGGVLGDFDADGRADLAFVERVQASPTGSEEDGAVPPPRVRVLVVPAEGGRLALRRVHPVPHARLPEATRADGTFRSERVVVIAGTGRGRADDLAVATSQDEDDPAVFPHTRVDLLHGGSSGLGSGARSESWTAATAGLGVGELSFVAFGDFDGDGDEDLALSDTMANAVAVVPGVADGAPDGPPVVLRAGRGGLAPAASDRDQDFGHVLAAGDLDGDGRDDLAVSGWSRRVWLLRGSARGLGSAGGQLFVPGAGGLPRGGVDTAFGEHLSVLRSGRGGLLLIGDPAADGFAGAVVSVRLVPPGERVLAASIHPEGAGTGSAGAPRSGDLFGGPDTDPGRL